MDFERELGLNQTILFLMPSENYNDDIVEVLKELEGNICYVTLNKTYDSLIELFKRNKVSTKNIVFIDAISRTIKNVPDQSEDVYYVSSPAALTELSIVIEKFIKHNFDYVIFDSLTNLLIYEKKAPVAKFVSSLVNKIKNGKTRALFYALSIKEQDELIKQTSMFVDKVIQL